MWWTQYEIHWNVTEITTALKRHFISLCNHIANTLNPCCCCCRCYCCWFAVHFFYVRFVYFRSSFFSFHTFVRIFLLKKISYRNGFSAGVLYTYNRIPHRTICVNSAMCLCISHLVWYLCRLTVVFNGVACAKTKRTYINTVSGNEQHNTTPKQQQ